MTLVLDLWQSLKKNVMKDTRLTDETELELESQVNIKISDFDNCIMVDIKSIS